MAAVDVRPATAKQMRTGHASPGPRAARQESLVGNCDTRRPTLESMPIEMGRTEIQSVSSSITPLSSKGLKFLDNRRTGCLRRLGYCAYTRARIHPTNRSRAGDDPWCT